MKFLTFVDVHENRKSIKELVSRASQKDIDFVLCAGDFSTFGRGLRYILRLLQELGKPIYIIPGNHEEREGLLEEVLPAYSNCINLHQQAMMIGDHLFLGYGGGGFTQEDAEFRKLAREWYGKRHGAKIVLVTHGPPFATKLDILHGQHVGNKDYRRFIERIKPKLTICGHLHETAGATDVIGPTRLVNPGWEGMVIELK